LSQAEKRLFFFTEFYHPAENTTGYYMTRIIHAAAQRLKSPVTVCCAVPSDRELPASKCLKVKRLKTGRYDKRKPMQRIITQALMTVKFAVYAMLNVKRKDVVFAVTNPAFLMLSLAILRTLKSFKYALLIYDVHPENLIPAGLATQGSLRYWVAARCFNWAYRAADELIVIGRDMEEVIRSKVGNRCRITLIPNWADVNGVRPQPKGENQIVREHKLQDKTVFLFAGNLGRVQGIGNLLAAIQRTQSQSAAFLFAGDGVFQPEIELFIRENPYKHVVHLGRLPISTQQLFLNACDVALVTLDDAMYGLGVPSKSYFSMAAGKPLLLVAHPESEIGRVVKEERIGWIVPPNDPEALARKVDEVCSSTGLPAMGARAREVAQYRFSEQAVLSQYSDWFLKLLNGDAAKGEPRQSHGRQKDAYVYESVLR
jgi:glycosyltransferase involved in cell wall biosynthesis